MADQQRHLVVATHNSGKLEEIRALLNGTGFVISSLLELGLPVPEETEATFLGNARLKAHAAARATGILSLADDSGLEVDVLGGAPGVHTADWAETATGRDFDLAMERVHAGLVESAAPSPWTARFRCALVLAYPGGSEQCFEGRVEGQIVWPPRGRNGHGYDPIFQPDFSQQTFGEMDRWEKNRLSHRGQAMAALLQSFT